MPSCTVRRRRPGPSARSAAGTPATASRPFSALVLLALALTCVLLASGCAGASQAGQQPVLHIGAIPDQDPEELQRMHQRLSGYLSDELGLPVEYVPVTDYAAAVTAFRVGDLDVVWFGGLTGVQARLQVPGAVPLAQRDIDAHFRSVFIAHTGSGIEPFTAAEGLGRLVGHTFTFGSQTSTSGRLMPQYFLSRAGVQLSALAGAPGFSGSHDATIDLVEAGSFDAGVLNEQVWRDRVAAGTVDLDRVREVWRTPPYQDYHWLARPDLDQRFGRGTTARVRRALLGLDADEPDERRILDLFGARRFVPTRPGNYDRIEQVGRAVGLVRAP